MAKLHELVAVKGNLDGQATKCRTELMGTFEKKRHLFEEKRLTFTPSSVEGGEGKAVTEEQKDIQTTVAAELSWIENILAKSLDLSYQIDVGNTLARADVVTENDEIILKDVPATSLLQLEHRLEDLHGLAVAIPTLDPAKGFHEDAHRGHGIFKAREVTKQRTKKTARAFTLAPPTKEHPAQVQLVNEDVPVGTILEQEWSSLITPTQKSQILDQIDILRRAVKRARAKANEQDVETHGLRIGKKVLDFVFQPITSSGRPVHAGEPKLQSTSQT